MWIVKKDCFDYKKGDEAKEEDVRRYGTTYFNEVKEESKEETKTEIVEEVKEEIKLKSKKKK